MKLESNWKQKTLENLEKDVWQDDVSASFIVNRISALGKIPLEKFTVEDLRIMIGQEIGLDYLMPLALDELRKDIWAEGDYYEGDLLQAVLKIREDFWVNNKNHWIVLNELIKNNKADIEEKKIDTTAFNKYK